MLAKSIHTSLVLMIILAGIITAVQGSSTREQRRPRQMGSVAVDHPGLMSSQSAPPLHSNSDPSAFHPAKMADFIINIIHYLDQFSTKKNMETPFGKITCEYDDPSEHKKFCTMEFGPHTRKDLFAFAKELENQGGFVAQQKNFKYMYTLPQEKDMYNVDEIYMVPNDTTSLTIKLSVHQTWLWLQGTMVQDVPAGLTSSKSV